MKKTSKFLNISLLIISLQFTFSCTTDLDWNQGLNNLTNGQAYIIPIGQDSLSLKDILAHFDSINFISSDTDNIYVVYNDTLLWRYKEVSNLGNNIIPIKKEFYPGIILASPFISGPLSIPFDDNLDLGINTDITQQRIDSSVVKSAKINYRIDITDIDLQASDIKIIITFQNNRFKFKNGASSIRISPTALSVNQSEILNAFTLNTAGGTSMLPVHVEVEVNPSTLPTPLLLSSKIEINVMFSEIKSSVIYGFFTPKIGDGLDNKIVDLTEYTSLLPQTGIFKLAEPEVSLDFENSVGIKLGLLVDEIKAYRSTDSAATQVYAKFNGSNVTQRTLDRVLNYLDPPVTTHLILNHEAANGEIAHFFDTYPLPDRLNYRFKVSNVRTLADKPDFIVPNASIKAMMGIKVPLRLNAGSSFMLSDTLRNLNLDSILNADVIQKVQLMLQVSNGLPVKGIISLQFLDNSNQPIQGLNVHADTIKAPEINVDGTVLNNSKTVSDLNYIFEKTQITLLKDTKSIAYTFSVENEANRKIALQPKNNFKIKVGVYLKSDQLLKFN